MTERVPFSALCASVFPTLLMVLKPQCPSIASFASAWLVAVRVPSSAPCTGALPPSMAWQPSSPAHSHPTARSRARRARSCISIRSRVYDSYEEMADREAALPAERADRLRLDRHAEPRPLPDCESVHRARHPCHLRQADDDDARGRGGALPTRADARRGVRADAQLQRLPAREASARAGARG